MAKHLVTMLVGIIVEAEDKDAALKKASLPLQYGALPGLCAMVSTGARLATEDDENGGIQRKIEAMNAKPA